MKKLFRRWHRYDNNGVKYIKKFDIDETPNPLIEIGYTQWVRGTGKMKPEHYEKIVPTLVKNSRGIPKSTQTKYKMRLAKLGVKKSESHKENMRRAWNRKKQEANRSEIISMDQRSLGMDTE